VNLTVVRLLTVGQHSIIQVCKLILLLLLLLLLLFYFILFRNGYVI